jgi:hypothetical protein
MNNRDRRVVGEFGENLLSEVEDGIDRLVLDRFDSDFTIALIEVFK